MTALTILDRPIRFLDNLYSLNDLHKAAGNEDRHRPVRFMRLDQTQKLIQEIEQCSDLSTDNEINQRPDLVFTAFRGGIKQGTWVCRELVYAYAMWISAKFHLQVIRAFDAMVSQPQALPKTTANECADLQNAINLLVSKKGLLSPDAYAMVHQRFNVQHLDQLENSQLTDAIEYVHKLAIEGELLPKHDEGTYTITRGQAMSIYHLLNHVSWVEKRWQSGIGAGLREMGSPLYVKTHEHVTYMARFGSILERDLAPILTRFSLQNLDLNQSII